ncbi:MAG: response regulator [Desulfobacterales bacterium]|nr:response regulator [Desulfobacterales bacterium]
MVTPSEMSPECAPLKVLLVEDNELNQKLTSAMLKKLGHWVTTANDGRQALEAYEKDPFDIIFMDIQMPVMDGLAASRSIRQLELASKSHRPRVPILALTATTDDTSPFLEAGMDGCLAKPVQPSALEGAIAQYHPGGCRGPFLLVLSDPGERKKALKLLSRHGECRVVGSSQEAMEILKYCQEKNAPCRAVIADADLEETDGFHLLTQIRKWESSLSPDAPLTVLLLSPDPMAGRIKFTRPHEQLLEAPLQADHLEFILNP